MSYRIEMNQSPEPESPKEPMSKGEFLAKLGEKDRANVETISQLFVKTAEEQQRSGILLAVGGILTKPGPRPDIDLVLALRAREQDPKRHDYPNAVTHARADFEKFYLFVKAMLASNSQLRVQSVTQPYVEYELHDPNSLLHDGSITIKNRSGGIPIELIRYPWETKQTTPLPPNRPYVILAHSEPEAKEIASGPKQIIPFPNLSNPAQFQTWLEIYIKTPSDEARNLKHTNGESYTLEEQLKVTREQIVEMIKQQRQKKRPLEQILKAIMEQAERTP